MDRTALANEMRAAQKKLGKVPVKILDLCTDEDMIDSYVTCSCCNQKLAEGSDLDYAISTATNKDHFMDIVHRIGQVKHDIGDSR